MRFKKIFFIASFLAVFGFMFNFSAPNVEAMTVAEMQVLIQQLRQQIAELEMQLLIQQLRQQVAQLQRQVASPVAPVIPDSDPAITVLSPNGGERWEFGRPQTINWRSTGINRVVIQLWFPDGAVCRLATDVPAAPRQHTLTLHQNQRCPNISRDITAGRYRIYVRSIDDPTVDFGIRDHSDNFFDIVAPAPAPVPAPTATISATPNPIAERAHGTLTWSSTNATSCTGTNFSTGVGNPIRGAASFSTVAPITYTVTCTGPGGSVRSSVTVNIAPTPAPPITVLPDIQITDMIPTSVIQNEFTTYTATVRNNSSQNITIPFVVSLDGHIITVSSLSAWQTRTVSAVYGSPTLGSYQVCVRADILNTVAESNELNNDFCRTVNVIAMTAPTITSTSPTSGRANDTITVRGSNLRDTVPSGIVIEFLQGGVQTGVSRNNITLVDDSSLRFQLSGLLVENMGPGNYQIRLVNDHGRSNTLNFSILAPIPPPTPAPVPAPTATISATPNPVMNGGATTLVWNSTNATSCIATAGSGFSTGGAVNGADTSTALTANTTFTVSCTGAGGTVQQSVTATIAPPSILFSASPSSVVSGGTTTLTWSSPDATSCTATAGPGFSTGLAVSGSDVSTALTSDTTFTIRCDGAGGSTNRSVWVPITTVSSACSIAPGASTASETRFSAPFSNFTGRPCFRHSATQTGTFVQGSCSGFSLSGTANFSHWLGARGCRWYQIHDELGANPVCGPVQICTNPAS